MQAPFYPDVDHWRSSSQPLGCKDEYFEEFGELQNGLFLGQLDAVDCRHGIDFEFCFGRLERPRQVVDLNAMNDSRAHHVKAVALSDETLEIAFVLQYLAGGAIARPQRSATWLLSAFAAISDLVGRPGFNSHVRPEIRQPGSSPSPQHRQHAGSIQAEEIDTRSIPLLRSAHIGAYVQFRKHGSGRNRRQRTNAHTAHPEWNHANPRFSLKRIQFQIGWNKRTQVIRRQ